MHKYSNIVDIPLILSTLEDYVVVKRSPEFPNYYDFDDIDIFSLNPQKFVQDLIASIKLYHKHPARIIVTEKDYNVHVDIWPHAAPRLNLRFDVYRRFPYYKFKATHEYYQKIIDRAAQIQCQDHIIPVPIEIDDLVVRFFEWIEHPSKIKHLNYVKNKCLNKEQFFEVVNNHTDIKEHYLEALRHK